MNENEFTEQQEQQDTETLEIAILGAAGGGVEVAVFINDIADEGEDVRVIGFVDDNPALEGKEFLGLPVLGNTEWALSDLSRDIRIISSIGNTAKKQNVINKFAEAGFSFYKAVHPDAYIGPGVKIGEGSVVAPGVILTTSVEVGEHCFLNVGTAVSHDVVIGSFSTINQGARIAGSVKLGRGVYLGASATVLHSVEINDFAVIGACALVNRPVPPRVTAVGIPARVVHSKDGHRGGGRRDGGNRGGSRGGGYRQGRDYQQRDRRERRDYRDNRGRRDQRDHDRPYNSFSR